MASNISKKTSLESPVKESNFTSRLNPVHLFLGFSVLLIVGLISLTFVLFQNDSSSSASIQKTGIITKDAVKMESNRQIVSVKAKNGFAPASITARAGTPTTLKVTTENTFDCSSTINIPSLGISKALPATGMTEIEIPAQDAGKVLDATCSMGMYPLHLQFVDES